MGLNSLNHIKIGLYEKAIPSWLSWEEKLSIARQAGYDFVEISVDESDDKLGRLYWSNEQICEVKEAINRTGVPILTMCLSGNRKYTIGSEDPELRARGVEIIKRAIELSVKLGIRIVQLASYDEYYNVRNEQTEKLFFDSLKEVVGFASLHAVTLAFENMDTDFINSIQKAMCFVKKINSPWLQVYPDIGNLTAQGFSTEEIKRDFFSGAGHITAIHLKDAQIGEIRRVPYGEGIVDFVSLFAVLQNLGFNGLFVAEMWSDEKSESIKYIQKAREFLLKKIDDLESMSI
jgi:L-ribulose-5-phosphate 3-epimerase